jgi:hypothetical protein
VEVDVRHSFQSVNINFVVSSIFSFCPVGRRAVSASSCLGRKSLSSGPSMGVGVSDSVRLGKRFFRLVALFWVKNEEGSLVGSPPIRSYGFALRHLGVVAALWIRRRGGRGGGDSVVCLRDEVEGVFHVHHTGKPL